MTGLATFIQASAHHLPMIADGSVQCICTSPPFFGLRSYAGEQGVEWPEVMYRLNEWCEPVTVPGCDPGCAHEWTAQLRKGMSGGTASAKVQIKGQDNFQVVPDSEHHYCAKCGGWRGGLGMEPSPVAYIGHLILCLREWRRVLRDDGVCFVNLGDSYHGGKGASAQAWSGSHSDRKTLARAQHHVSVKGETRPQDRRDGPIKPKNLLMIPAMFAIAARADGWYLRSDIIWAKPNPMPESVTDRPTKAHEYIFLLAKSARYYWDAEAVKEPAQIWFGQAGEWARQNGKGNEPDSTPPGERPQKRADRKPTGIKFGGTKQAGSNGNPTYSGNEYEATGSRNLRSVWTTPTSPFPGSHFACWPERLVEPMVKAGSRPGDVVLDPFSGSGTTAKVAVRLGRRAIGVDISAEYLGDVTAQRFGAGVQMELVG